MRCIRNIVLSGVSAIALAAPAFAQDVIPADEEGRADDIVVTGTLVRGAAPTGTAVIGIDRSGVEATGATTVTQLLQTVPGFGSFNTAQAPIGGGNSVTTNRPNLRSLPASNLAGTASTLVLVDGHRVVGMGIGVTSPDLDAIAPGAIERVDIVPDGGSSTYGSDAVGGVVNFITRKTFDGVGVDGRFGFADDYTSWDANATVGKAWDNGGIYVSYNYSQHDAIFGRDRDWVRRFPSGAAPLGVAAIPTLDLTCKSGSNVQVINAQTQVQNNNAIYGLPFTLNTPNAAARLNQPNECDVSDYATIYPKERRHSVFARLTQDLSDSLSFDLTGFFVDRQQRAVTGPFRTQRDIGTSSAAGGVASPLRTQYVVDSANQSHRVFFAWGDEEANRQELSLRAWGVTPSFTYKLDDNWRLQALFNYGESNTIAHSPIFNNTALTNAIAAGSFNPYEPAKSNATALADIANWEQFGQAKQTQLQARAIIDGELFQLPAGGMKVALGVEILSETFRSQKGDIVPGTELSGFAGTALIPAGAALPVNRAARTVKSVFGEMVLPLAADEKLLQDLTVSFSARYDSYSDFGGTFNPKVGLTWKPIDQIRVRGQWGRSFSAPSLANSRDADPIRANWVSGAQFAGIVNSAGQTVLNNLGYPSAAQRNAVVLQGGSNDLQPQRAQTWSVGFDADPVPGMRLSLTYWNIKIQDVLGVPAFTSPARYFEQFTTSYTILPSLTEVDDALANAIVVGTPCNVAGCVYILERNFIQNLGQYRQDGFDAAVSYRRDTEFGSIDFNVALTYVLNRELSTSPVAALIDQIPSGVSKFKMRSTLGAQFDRLRAQVTWNHSSGYDYTPVEVGVAPFYPDQSHIGAFNTVDLFFKYDFAGEGAMKDLALTLGVNNVLDADPPVRYALQQTPSQYGYANGSTIGRFIQLGFSKRF